MGYLGKQASKEIQYQPVIIISGKRVPPIENEQRFNYLEKQFNFGMVRESIKVKLFCEIEEYLKKIDLFRKYGLFKTVFTQRFGNDFLFTMSLKL